MWEFVAGKGSVFHEREPAVLKGAGADGPVQLTNITAAPHGPPADPVAPARSRIQVFGLDLDSAGRHGTTGDFAWSD